MRAPFFAVSLSFAAGLVLSPWLTALSDLVLIAMILGVSPILYVLRGKKQFGIAAAVLTALLGCLHARYEPVLYDPKSIASSEWVSPYNEPSPRPIRVQGLVSSQPDIKTKGKKGNVSFQLNARKILYPGGSEHVSGTLQVFLLQSGVIPEFGDWITLRGFLRTPPPLLNPGGFDYSRYLEAQNIKAVFYGYGKYCVRIHKQNDSFLRRLYRVRAALKSKIIKSFHGGDQALMKALLLGDRKEISDVINDDFKKTGTVHLLAISGLNISLFAGTIYLLFLLSRLPQKGAAACAVLMTAFQAVMSGMEFSVQRAAIMAIFGFFAIILERERSSFNLLGIAFFLILLTCPKSIMHVGFQLSFLSVLALMTFLKGQWDQWLGIEGLQSTLAATLGTFPLILFYFNLFAPVSLVANLLAIPLFHLALLGGYLTLFVPAGAAWSFLSWIAAVPLRAGLKWIHVCAKIPLGHFYAASPSLTQVISYYLLLCAGFVSLRHPEWLGRYARWRRAFQIASLCGLAALAVVMLWPKERAQLPVLTLLSAGKNEMLVYQRERKTWIINTGRGEPSLQSRWILEPYLRSKGVQSLDGVLLTDLKKKHTGGLESLTRNFRVKRLGVLLEGGLPRPQKGMPERIRQAMLIDRRWMDKISGIEILTGEAANSVIKMTVQQKKIYFLTSYGKSGLEAFVGNEDLKKAEILLLPAVNWTENDLKALSLMPDLKLILTPSAGKELREWCLNQSIFLMSSVDDGAVTCSVFFSTGMEANREVKNSKAFRCSGFFSKRSYEITI